MAQREQFSKGRLTAQSGPSLDESAAGTVRERIRGRLGRSLHVRQVDAGSCNGCEQEIAKLAKKIEAKRYTPHHYERWTRYGADPLPTALVDYLGRP